MPDVGSATYYWVGIASNSYYNLDIKLKISSRISRVHGINMLGIKMLDISIPDTKHKRCQVPEMG
jgi:hypothetical protein